MAVRVEQLSRVFSDIYGPNGLVVDSTAALAGGQSHSAHFAGGFESEFSQFGIALTSQLVSLPQPTPAAGFTYQFDPALGIFTRTTNSFGPIMSERAETIGARRLSLGVATQRLEFDSIEGLTCTFRRCSPTTTPSCAAAARTSSPPPTRWRPRLPGPRSSCPTA